MEVAGRQQTLHLLVETVHLSWLPSGAASSVHFPVSERISEGILQEGESKMERRKEKKIGSKWRRGWRWGAYMS